MARMQVTAVIAVVAALVLGTLLTACAVPGQGSGGEPETLLLYGEPVDLGVPGALLGTVPGVAGYPACGNEPITHDGTTWYPYEPANLDAFPTVAALAVTGATPGGFGGGLHGGAPRIVLPVVVAPGPGDDVGTLVVYEGGFAHWRSDSGDLETWLTDRPLEYAWAC